MFNVFFQTLPPKGALNPIDLKNAKSLQPKVYPVPAHIDQEVARLKLESMGVRIDKLTPEQEQYLASWSEGT
jgi:adenosylhomocysteinase